MAIQNFINGGFTGKIGEVIGQGWKNQRVLRTYQKPRNPKTKAQQANRGNFAQCVKMAQLAMQMNWKSQMFVSDETTQWSIRIGTARKLFDKSLPEMYALPLVPYGTVAKYGIADGLDKITGGIQLTVDSEENLGGRSVSVLLYTLDTSKNEYDYFVIQSVVVYDNGVNTVAVMLPQGAELVEDTLGALVSNDDDVFSDIILMPTRKLGKAKELVTFTLSNPRVTSFSAGDTAVKIALSPSISLTDSAVTVSGAEVRGVLQGAWKEYTNNATSSVAGNVLSLTFENAVDTLGQRVQFPAGAKITVPAFSFSDDDYIYTHEEEEIAFSETVAEQSGILNELYAYFEQQSYVTFRPKETATSYGGTHSGGTISVPCVINNAVNVRTANLPSALQSEAEIFTYLLQEYNYWGKERLATLNLSGLWVVVNGIRYNLRDNDTITLPPKATELLVTADKITSSVNDYYTSSGNHYQNFTMVCDGIGAFASLFTSSVLPASITFTYNGTSFSVGNFQNMARLDDRRIECNYSGSWVGTYDEEPYPQGSFSLRQNLYATSEVANSDGFKSGIDIKTSDTISCYFNSWDNS